MCVGKNRSGAKKPNNGHPKKERGVVVSRFEPGTKGRVFFSPLPQLLRLTGKKQKVGGGMGGGDWLRARLTKNTASFVWTIKGKINPLIINLLSAKLYFIINK